MGDEDFEPEDYYDIKEIVKPTVKLVLKLKNNGANNKGWVVDSNIRQETVAVKNKPKSEQSKPLSATLGSPNTEEEKKKKKYQKAHVDVNNIIDKDFEGTGKRITLRPKKASKYSEGLDEEEEFFKSLQKKRGRPSKYDKFQPLAKRRLRLDSEEFLKELSNITPEIQSEFLSSRPEDRKPKLRDPAKPKRPTSAFRFFLRDYRNKFKNQFQGLKPGVITLKLADLWRSIDPVDVQPYEALAQQDFARYNREMASYVPPPDAVEDLDDDSDDSEDESTREAELILDKRFNPETSEEEYLVKWKGIDESTWEPMVALSSFFYLVEQFERNAALQMLVQQDQQPQLQLEGEAEYQTMDNDKDAQLMNLLSNVQWEET